MQLHKLTGKIELVVVFFIVTCCSNNMVLSAFALGTPVRRISQINATNTSFDTIQAAYDSTSTVSTDTIECQSGLLGEDLFFDKPLSINLTGGFDTVFGNDLGLTTVGSLIIADGSVVVEKIEIHSYTVYGLDFSPYIDGQDPNLGSIISEDQLRSRMTIIAPYTQWIRSFGSTKGLEKTGSVAHGLNLKAAIGAWLGNENSVEGKAANEQEISNLISAAKAGYVDLAIVGSEVLYRNDLTETQLIAYINRVKQEVPTINVTTADVYSELLAHPSVIYACDVVFVNYYPYWEGIKVDYAIASLHALHQQMTAAAGEKSVVVSETGWPSNGNQIGNAMPSIQNASFYFMNFVSWARANNALYFYFEAFDESWKATTNEGPQGAHWGVWDKNGTLKPDMQDVFDGKTIPDNWSNAIPGGAGTPLIEFTYVPQYGSFDNLKGQVLHVKPSDYAVAVYIYVSGWWTKPNFISPVTAIKADGSWECDITTGGTDQNATRIAAYLVPSSYNPPSASGSSTLPSELDSNGFARVEAIRSP